MFCFVWLCFTDTSIFIEYYQLRVAYGIKAANDMTCDNDKVLIISMPQESRTTCRIGKHELSKFFGAILDLVKLGQKYIRYKNV